jgi:hypothetical protein
VPLRFQLVGETDDPAALQRFMDEMAASVEAQGGEVVRYHFWPAMYGAEGGVRTRFVGAITYRVDAPAGPAPVPLRPERRS